MLWAFKIIVPVLLDDERVERLLEALPAECVATCNEPEYAWLLLFTDPVCIATIHLDGIITYFTSQRLFQRLICLLAVCLPSIAVLSLLIINSYYDFLSKSLRILTTSHQTIHRLLAIT